MEKIFICDGCNNYRLASIRKEYELEVKTENTVKIKHIWLCKPCQLKLGYITEEKAKLFKEDTE